MSNVTSYKIGWIGTGVMGAPMALNLLKAGFELVVFNRTRAKAEPLLQAGAQWANNPIELAKDKDFVITCVSDTPDVESVLLGEAGVVHSAKRGAICIDMSTISPKATRWLASQLLQRDIFLLDAPVSGGQLGAIEAKLSIMVGGPQEAFEKAKPILSALGKTITYCGPSGFGQMTKLVNQVMVVHTVMSMAEGLAFAEKAGLDLQITHAATCGGAAYSHSLKVLGQKVLAGDMKPAFAVDLQFKDLRLVMEMAEQIGQPLPGTALIMQLFASLKAKGRGKDGTQALIDVLRELRTPADKKANLL